MQSGEFHDADFFRVLTSSPARALLIGRRALIALGAPVMTVDYDLWVHIDDIEVLNASLAELEQFPDRTPAEARARGRYVIENGERVDVMIARSATDSSGTILAFSDAWDRRQTLEIHGYSVATPSIADLILTKRWGGRPKDVVDIQWLTELGGKS